MSNDIAALNKKIDHLTELFEEQNRRQQSIDELKQDLLPIANHMVKLSINELDDIGNEFQLEDLLFLFKRVLRDTHMLIDMMDKLEGIYGMSQEIELLGKQVFSATANKLDEMERAGFFSFAQQGWQMIERIVTEFDEDDVQALGDNIVTILMTVRNMTQPDILALANNAVDAIRDEPNDNGNLSTWALLRELSDPSVRKGMARMLNMLKTLADQPKPPNQN
ncbi:MAG: DUF1641 domain-containing protein [Anaerolineae bacterium]|nr:DUF1641 domain-containing protein [Anaerolineae bacterium]